MKKSVRSLLIMLAVLVVLGGATALLLLPTDGETEDTSSTVSEDTRETLALIAEEDLVSVKVENSRGSFEIVPVSGESAETESGTGGTAYTIKGFEKYDLDTSGLKTAAQDVLTITASRSLGEQEDLEKYGLAGEGAGKVTVEQKNGETLVLTLGNTSSSGTTGQYILKDGQVYIVPTLSDVLLGSDLDCISCAVYSIPDWTVEVLDENGEATENTIPDTIFSLELTGEAFAEPITLEYVEKSRLNGYMLTSPIRAESGTTAFDTMLDTLKNLTANTVAAADVEESDLAQYGLDRPDAQVTFDMNGHTVTLKVSKKDAENNRFLMMEGSDLVYSVNNSRVSAWAEAQLMDLRKSTVCLANINNVSHLTLTAKGDMVYDFTIDLHAEEKTVQIPGGTQIDYEAYAAFFRNLTSLAVFTLEDVPHSGTPDLRVEYRYDGEDEDVVEFFRIEGQDRYACTLNGEFTGQIRGSEMTPLLRQLEEL